MEKTKNVFVLCRFIYEPNGVLGALCVAQNAISNLSFSGGEVLGPADLHPCF